MQEQRLQTNRTLQDIDGIAAAQWSLGQIRMAQERWGEASSALAEAWQLFTKLGRLDGIAVAGQIYG